MRVTANSKGNGLVLEREAVLAAVRDLGLTLPVHVTFCPKPSGLRSVPGVFVGGRYCGIDTFNPVHTIRLTNRATTRKTSAFLWHELVHAFQCERAGSNARFDAEYNRQLAAIGLAAKPQDAAWYAAYRMIPYEAEAFAVQAHAEAGDLPMLVQASEAGRP